jgi:hypothetical protein
MALIFVDLLTLGCIDGLDVSQVTFLPDQVVPVIGSVLDDNDTLEVDSEVLDPFLHCLLNPGVKAFQPDLKAAAIMV